MNSIIEWQRTSADNFWGEIAPTDHVVQIYENDQVFLDTLSGFIGSGINAGDCVIIIATRDHLDALDTQLLSYGVHVPTLVQDERYIPLDAQKTLDRFMVNGWPDETLFNQCVSSIIQKGTKKGRKVRAFGEMVALLWANGQNGATVQLEHLWNKFWETQSFSLFCAYPKSGFTQDINESIQHICGCHKKMLRGSGTSVKDIYYTDVTHKTAV